MHALKIAEDASTPSGAVNTPITLHIFVGLGLIFWLIQLLRIFLHTQLLHTFFPQMLKNHIFARYEHVKNQCFCIPNHT